MKNSTLVFRSLAVIIFIAGGAHLVRYAAQYKNYGSSLEESSIPDKTAVIYNEDDHITAKNKFEPYDIIGKWKVSYNTEDFNGAVIYNIKKEGDSLIALTYQYLDENGNTQEAEGTKVLTIKKFDGTQGIGIYELEYEEQAYQVDCQITMLDATTFKLSYDYYGYSDIEIWKKQ